MIFAAKVHWQRYFLLQNACDNYAPVGCSWLSQQVQPQRATFLLCQITKQIYRIFDNRI